MERIPALQYGVEELIDSQYGQWDFAEAPSGSVIGTSFGRGVVADMGGLVVVSNWYCYAGGGELVGGYTMRVLGGDPLVYWPAYATDPGQVTFKRTTGKLRELPPDFSTAMLLADLVMSAEATDIPDFPNPGHLVRRASDLWTHAMKLLGEQEGGWPYHP